MQLKNSETRYGHVARVLHWTSVGLLLASVILGAELAPPPSAQDRVEVIARHSSIGILLLAVMLMRFSWRLNSLNPVRSYTVSAWQQRAAISLHWFLYAVVISQCLVGLAQLFADGSPIEIFDLVLLESSGMRDDELRERLNDIHASFANVIYVVIAVHVGAAIYHQIFAVVDDARA